MRMRQNRATVKDSLATTLEVENREHLVQLIVDALGNKGVVVNDEMIHVSHYGFDERIGWDEHIIVVDRFGVFGFTDGPCPTSAIPADLASQARAVETSQQLFSAEIKGAYGHEK